MVQVAVDADEETTRFGGEQSSLCIIIYIYIYNNNIYIYTQEQVMDLLVDVVQVDVDAEVGRRRGDRHAGRLGFRVYASGFRV